MAEQALQGEEVHTGVVTMDGEGVSESVRLTTIRELRGHATLNRTLRYAHLAPGMHEDAIDALDHRADRTREQPSQQPPAKTEEPPEQPPTS